MPTTEPNVIAMATYGVGDLMTTKPYVSGAAYIDRMSDYCRGCRFDPKSDCPLTPIYWAFLECEDDNDCEDDEVCDDEECVAAGCLDRCGAFQTDCKTSMDCVANCEADSDFVEFCLDNRDRCLLAEECYGPPFCECDVSDTSATCYSECREFIAEGCGAIDCLSACVVTGTPDAAESCFARRDGCELTADCRADVATCEAECAEMIGDGCLPDLDCATLCADPAAPYFTSCASRRVGCEPPPDCASGTGSLVEDCQLSCEDMVFFDCIDASQNAACFTRCESASEIEIDSFIACNAGLCSDDSCLAVFLD